MIHFLTVNYHSADWISKLINSLPERENKSYKLIIVNNSPEDTKIHDLLNDSIHLINSEVNLGFGRACNLGLNYIYALDSQAIVWIINPDAYLLDNKITEISDFFVSHSEVSILGTTIYTPEKKVWFAGGVFSPETGYIFNHTTLQDSDKDYSECDWISGCSLILNLKNFSKCPFFDSAYFLYYEDFDFCQRYIKLGHKVGITNRFAVIHQASAITNQYTFRKIKHSTYSYIFTLHRYANHSIFYLRFLRLFIYSCILIVINPKIAAGKFAGILMYWQWSYQNMVSQHN
ncbi:glycosyltransferase family 2 protein [Calothrix sp. 336/3]|uniref:glycosyltransferase family 2 protein n=1 Tax=Calothrix sp. 336/3 TaxID=1337936 RepID=UPI0004E3643A|nr:glycosyltransferase family 2 protein [Calothrix sp. 336/3]AKG22261.1 glycosyl transferase [Calothrix sp. 336/3]